MKRFMISVLFIALAASLFGAEFKVEGENFRYYNQKGRKYNPATVETVRGTVATVETFKLSETCTGFVHLSLKSGNDTIGIALAPGRYLEGKISVTKGDSVEITGSKYLNDSGEKLIIARSIRKDNVTVELRDEKGIPKWPMGIRKK